MNITKSKRRIALFTVLTLSTVLFVAFLASAAAPFIRTALNTGTVSNETAARIAETYQQQIFNRTTIATGIGNLSRESTIVKQRKDIGLVFDDNGDSVYFTNTPRILINSNFTILIKARPESSADTSGTFYYQGSIAGANNADYTVGYLVAGNALTFNLANGSTTDVGSYVGYAPFGQTSYFACGINESESRWCAINGNNVSSTSYSRNYTYANKGNTTILGSTAVSGNPGSDMNGTLYNVAVVNATLRGRQLDSYMWNDGRIVPAVNDTETTLSSLRTISNFDNGTLIIWNGSTITTSVDLGVTQSVVHNFPTYINGSATLWRDRQNDTYLNTWNNGAIFRSADNDLTTWTNVLNMSCDNSTNLVNTYIFPSNGMTRAPNGYLYVGSYATGDANQEEHCGHIWRSTDDGVTWTLVYNDTAVNPTYPGRHVHFVKADPYTGKIYVSIGDGEHRRKTLRSDDNGDTWIPIKVGIRDGISWQPTMIEFTENYRIIGEDFNPLNGYSKIWRSSDDVNWEVVFNNDETYFGFWSFSVKDSQGRIYTGINIVDNSSDMILVMSDDEFNTTNIMYVVENGTFADLNAGMFSFSVVPDVNDNFFINFQGQVRNITRIGRALPAPQVLAQWNLDENQGNTTERINGYAGISVGDTAWTNGSGYNTLNPNVDYRINTSATHGNITLLNNWFNRSSVDLTLASYTSDSIYNYLTGYYAFDADNSSTAFDYSPLGNQGVYVSTNFKSNTTGCIYGRCGKNIGGSGYVRIDDHRVSNISDNMTIMFWANIGNAGGGQLISKWAVTNNRMYAISCSPTGTYNLVFTYSMNGSSGAAQTSVQPGYFCQPNRWFHATISKEGNSWKFYKNGELYDNFTFSICPNCTSDVRIGEREGGLLNGSIDEVMFFNISLEQEQVERIYKNNSQRFQEYNYRNATYSITSSNRLNVSIPILTVINALNSVTLNVSAGSSSNSQSLLLPDTNYTFTLPDGTTIVNLNYTVRSNSRFITPVLGLNESYSAFTVEGSDPGSTEQSCVNVADGLINGINFTPVILAAFFAIIAIAMLTSLKREEGAPYINVPDGDKMSGFVLTVIGVCVILVIGVIAVSSILSC